MKTNVTRLVTDLKKMTVDQLREKYAEVFGETTNGRHKQWLIKRIAWRVQANEEGDLSERARRRAAELANDADLRMMPPRDAAIDTTPAKLSDRRLPLPGAVITRDYKGQTLLVTVLRDGFEFEGETYKSLSAVAKAATGTHWNGYLFFGLKKKGAAK